MVQKRNLETVLLCNQEYKNSTIIEGIYFLSITGDCIVKTDLFNFVPYKNNAQVINAEPKIIDLPNCCAEFLIPNPEDLNQTLTLNNIRKINDMKLQIVQIKTRWDKFKQKKCKSSKIFLVTSIVGPQ